MSRSELSLQLQQHWLLLAWKKKRAVFSYYQLQGKAADLSGQRMKRKDKILALTWLDILKSGALKTVGLIDTKERVNLALHSIFNTYQNLSSDKFNTDAITITSLSTNSLFELKKLNSVS